MNTLSLLFALLTFAPEAWAFGGGKTEEPPVPETPPVVQAKPLRLVKLAHITVPAFTFPNGVRADFNADLDKLIETEVNASRYFRTQVSTPENEPRLILTGGITSLEMDVLEFNLKIGWNTNGPIALPGTPFAHGEIDLRLSSLSMDFKVYDRLTGQTYLASYTDEQLSKLKIEVRVNVDNITGSLDVLYKTKIADAIRLATRDIMANLERNQNFDLLPWEARVLGVDGESGRAVFDAGTLMGVAEHQIYSIYSHCADGDGECFTRFLADAKVERVGQVSAEAVPLTPQDSFHAVVKGDRVFVKPLPRTER